MLCREAVSRRNFALRRMGANIALSWADRRGLAGSSSSLSYSTVCMSSDTRSQSDGKFTDEGSGQLKPGERGSHSRT